MSSHAYLMAVPFSFLVTLSSWAVTTESAATQASPSEQTTPASSTPAQGQAGGAQNNTEADIKTMSRDEWFGKLKLMVPDLICKGFLQDPSLKQQLDSHHIDYDKCVSLIPASIDKCQAKLAATIPDKVDEQVADKWGHTVGECIGKDFAINYLL